jgi:hypothetical protein
MRLLVSGSREWSNRDYLFGVLDGIHASQDVTVLIEGEARGADELSREWANGHRIKVLPFPAKWDEQGRAAGVIRNESMIRSGRPELVVAFWNGTSKGTAHLISAAREAGLEVWIFTGPKAPGAARPLSQSS